MTFWIPTKRTLRSKTRRKGRWSTADASIYSAAVDARMALLKAEDQWQDMAINEKCNAIEAALLETAEQYHAKVDNNLGDAFDFFAKAKLLMRNRRSALCA